MNTNLAVNDSGTHTITRRTTRATKASLLESHRIELEAERARTARVEHELAGARRETNDALQTLAHSQRPKKSLAASVGGALLGCFVPLSAHTLVASSEFATSLFLHWLVAACLAYSAPTVCAWAGEYTTAGAKHWAAHVLGWVKAVGFVGCLEGILVGTPGLSCAWLSWLALAMLMGINAVILGAKFRERGEEKSARAVG